MTQLPVAKSVRARWQWLPPRIWRSQPRHRVLRHERVAASVQTWGHVAAVHSGRFNHDARQGTARAEAGPRPTGCSTNRIA
jgi:hypothetical protein